MRPICSPPELAVLAGGSEYNIMNNIEVNGLGDSGRSELMMVTFVNEDICFHINNLSGVENPSGTPPDYTAAATFSLPADTDESFPDFDTNSHGFNAPAFEIGGGAGEAPELENQSTGCFLASNSLNEYVFYHVLSKR